uniref:7TM_GPCR_Srx domain-containing protein n=1 Tax=Heterorhabditis bacteriophora TaxID=37862 RepID=A0A1I7W925_HETBA
MSYLIAKIAFVGYMLRIIEIIIFCLVIFHHYFAKCSIENNITQTLQLIGILYCRHWRAPGSKGNYC